MSTLLIAQPRRTMQGFSLVEIMVAMVIGLIGMMVMMQMLAVFEGQKRSTTGGGEAQGTGAITLFNLQRDIQQAGYGISALNLIGCDVQLRAGPPAVTLSSMAPVVINPPASVVVRGDANTDTLLVTLGNSNGPVEGDGITTQPGANTYAVQTPTSFNIGDQVIATAKIRPPSCNGANSLILTAVTGVASPNVTVGTSVAGVTNGQLYNLGQAPAIRAYAVRNGNLTMCDYTLNDCGDATQVNPVLNTAVWTSVADGVVSLRAQYGHDTTVPMDGIVDAYDQISPVSACNWAKTSAVRIALVVRNGKFEKDAVTGVAGGAPTPTWDGNANTPINLAAGGGSWKNYRYKVFQTTVPLRNIISLGVQAGC